MTQEAWQNLVPSTDTGTTLSDKLNALIPTLYSQHSGNSRPTYAEAGMLWIDTTNPNEHKLYLYDGSQDQLIASFDPAISGSLKIKDVINVYDTYADLAAESLDVGELARAKGYSNVEDGQTALFQIRPAGTLGGVELANGNVAVPYTNDKAGRRNLIINGDFSVTQRGTSFPNHSAGYHLDRWYTTSGRNVYLDESDPPNTQFSRSIRIDNGTGSSLNLRQSVELMAKGDAGLFQIGRTFTISGYLKVTQPGRVINLTAAFTDGPTFEGRADLFNEVLLTGDGDWQHFEYAFTVDVVPNSTNTSLTIQFSSDADSVLTEARFTGLQLEESPFATPFELLPIQQQIALCQRYYFRSPYNWIRLRSANAQGANITHRTTMALPQRMRTVPTSSITGYQSNERIDTAPIIYVPSEPEQFASRDTVGIFWVPTGTATFWGFAIGIIADAEL